MTTEAVPPNGHELLPVEGGRGGDYLLHAGDRKIMDVRREIGVPLESTNERRGLRAVRAGEDDVSVEERERDGLHANAS